jgi:hypothetical protein
VRDQENFTIKIARRPWYEWLLWGLWLFLEAFFFQSAVASNHELEPRAAMIYWLIFGILFLAGFIVWFIRRKSLL